MLLMSFEFFSLLHSSPVPGSAASETGLLGLGGHLLVRCAPAQSIATAP